VQDSDSAPEDEYVGELRQAVADLHSSTESSFALISQIVARGDRLSADIATTRQNFSAGALFAEAVARAQESMKQIGDMIQLGAPLDDSEEPESGLADFMSHYTMQSEMDVHQGITGVATVSSPLAAQIGRQNLPSAAADDLDNVEFF